MKAMSLVDRFAKRIMWLRRSSMVRLALLLSLIFAVGMTAAIYVALYLGQEAIEQRMDATLEAFAATADLDDSEGESPSMIIRELEDIDRLPPPFRRAADRGASTINLERSFQGSDIWRVVVTRDNSGEPVLVAVPFEDSEEAQELLAGTLWTTTALVIALSLIIGLVAGILAQRRLARINTTLASLADGDLTARTGNKRSGDDLDDIASQLDRTAAELESLVAQTRNLSASLAHDLRTPLARLRARLELLPDGVEREDALEEAQRLSEVFDTIMRVARIEAAQGRDGFEAVRLDELVAELAEIFGPVVEDSGKELKVVTSESVSVQADKQMLVQAMANLIQNALVHGGAEITLIAEGTSIGVADNGAGVDPEHYAEIVKPMVRLDKSRATEGSGLGLALVRAVADRHAADLHLSPQNADHNRPGLKVILKFAEL